jgi:predicted RNase H-like HicB family nuclease
MKSIKVKATIERGDDGTYDVTMEYTSLVPFGLLGQGNTVEEAIADFYNSYKEMTEFLKEKGEEYPPIVFSFVYDIPSFLKQYAFAFSLAGLGRITGINERQLSHYINGVRKPSVNTVVKIENKLKAFANEISQVQFIK